jgi:hypothetical protein
MVLPKGGDDLPEPRRREIFKALVDAQDQDPNVSRSRKMIAERFGVSDGQLRKIELEGVDQGWLDQE